MNLPRFRKRRAPHYVADEHCPNCGAALDLTPERCCAYCGTHFGVATAPPSPAIEAVTGDDTSAGAEAFKRGVLTRNEALRLENLDQHMGAVMLGDPDDGQAMVMLDQIERALAMGSGPVTIHGFGAHPYQCVDAGDVCEFRKLIGYRTGTKHARRVFVPGQGHHYRYD